MTPYAERVWRFVCEQSLIPPAGRIAVAVSGGGDSVALLHLLAELAAEGHVALAGVVHVNHLLRPPACDEDERFCRRLAAQFDVPCVVETFDVAEVARRDQISIEHAGHRMRHACFGRAADRVGARHVALAHTMDDQAETVLLRMVRGAGAAGLSAMRPHRDRIIRPLLGVTRRELREYLGLRQIGFREDPSNLDTRIPRNRVRHVLMPMLREFSPNIAAVLSREAEIARADNEWLAQCADQEASRVVKRIEGGIAMSVASLSALPPAMSRRIVREALTRVSGRGDIGFEHVERFRRLVDETSGATCVDFPGCRAERVQGDVRVVARKGRGVAERVVTFHYRLEVPGLVAVPEAGVEISAEVTPAGAVPSSPREVAVRMPVGGHLTVRNRRPGDRLRPRGLGGHRKKLQDFLVDRKISRGARDRIPLVVDAEDRIIWVVGLGLGDDFRVTTDARSMLTLKVKSVGDCL